MPPRYSTRVNLTVVGLHLVHFLVQFLDTTLSELSMLAHSKGLVYIIGFGEALQLFT